MHVNWAVQQRLGRACVRERRSRPPVVSPPVPPWTKFSFLWASWILFYFYFALILVRSVSPTVQQFTWQRKNTFLFHFHFHLFQFYFTFSCCCLQNRSQNEILPCYHLEQASILSFPLHMRFCQTLLKQSALGCAFTSAGEESKKEMLASVIKLYQDLK